MIATRNYAIINTGTGPY